MEFEDICVGMRVRIAEELGALKVPGLPEKLLVNRKAGIEGEVLASMGGLLCDESETPWLVQHSSGMAAYIPSELADVPRLSAPFEEAEETNL